MKRTLSYILCTLLLLSSFTACKDNGKTEPQSDVSKVSSVASVAQPEQEPVEETVQEDIVEEAEPVTSAQEKEEKTEAAEPATSTTKQTEVKTETKKTTTSTEENDQTVTDKNQTSGGSGDIVRTYPTFESEAQLKNWLLNGDGTFEEERLTTLNSVQSNNTITYYRPKIVHDEGFVLRNLRVDNGSVIHACQLPDYVDKKPLWLYSVSVSSRTVEKDSRLSLYNEIQAKAQSGDEYYHSYTINGIEYVYRFDDSTKVYKSEVMVYWKQFGVVQSALVQAEKTQMNEFIADLLPLLELEKVTLSANSDHVTQ